MNSPFIEKLSAYCAEGDFTDSARLEDFATQYCALCASVNAKCAQLRKFVKANMREEARAWYAQQFPPLQEQVTELNFSGSGLFVDTLKICGLPVPEEIDSDVLFAYSELLQQGEGAAPLLDRFREVAKTDDNEQKLSIARQLQTATGSDEWRQTAEKLEGVWQEQLTAQAKEAILAKNHALLAQISKKLHGTPWVNPPRPEVLRKIGDTLHRHDLEIAGARVKNLVEKCDGLYRQDFEGYLPEMSLLLGEVDALRQEYPDYVMPADLAGVFAPLQEAVRQREAELEREEDLRNRREKALAHLEHLLKGGAAANELQQAYELTVSLGQEISPEVKYRYEVAYNAQAATERRQKVVRTLVAVTVVLLVLAGLAFGLASWSRHRLVSAYDARLEQILGDRTRPAAEAEAIYQEIEREHPHLLKTQRLVYQRQRLQEKRQAEEAAAARFAELEPKLLDELADFRANAVSLRETMKEMQALAQVPPCSERLAELQERYEGLERKYVKGQEDAYKAGLRQLRDLYRKFSVALEKSDEELALSLIGQMKEGLRDLEAIADVSPETKTTREAEDILAKVGNAETELRQSKMDQACLARVEEFEPLAKQFLQGYACLRDVKAEGKEIPQLPEEGLERIRRLPPEMRIDKVPGLLERFAAMEKEMAKNEEVSPLVRNRVREMAALAGECRDLGSRVVSFYGRMQELYVDLFDVTGMTHKECVNAVKRFCTGLPPCRESEILQRFQEEQLARVPEALAASGSLDMASLSVDYEAEYKALVQAFRTAIETYRQEHPAYAMLLLDSDKTAQYELFFSTTQGATLNDNYPFLMEGRMCKGGVRVEKLPVVGTNDRFSISTEAELTPQAPRFYPARLGDRNFNLFPRIRYMSREARVKMCTSLEELQERNPAPHRIWMDNALRQTLAKAGAELPREDAILQALRELTRDPKYNHDHWQRALLEQRLLHALNDFYAERHPNLAPPHAFAVMKTTADKLDALVADYGDKEAGDAWAVWSWNEASGYRAFLKRFDEVNDALDLPAASFAQMPKALAEDMRTKALYPVAVILKSLKDDKYWTISFYNYAEFYVWDAKGGRMVKAGTRSDGRNKYVENAGVEGHLIFSEPITLLYGVPLNVPYPGL